jgi:hypothetical protein
MASINCCFSGFCSRVFQRHPSHFITKITGWIKTVDQYYIERVQFILDTVTAALLANPDRKFTYVEIAFFKRWWLEQTPALQSQFYGLVANGQFKFNLGGADMNDEATTDFHSEINQMTEGAQFIMETFGDIARPTVGWHVDPFGHSASTASLWSDIGFDAFGLNRIDYRLKDQLKANQSLEFIWQGSTSLGQQTRIWAHVLDSHYCTPDEMGYDDSLFINVDPRLPTYGVNAAQQAQALVQEARRRNSWYKHNNILLPYGCDFSHQNAVKSFSQMDKMIDYINANRDTYNATIQYAHFASG